MVYGDEAMLDTANKIHAARMAGEDIDPGDAYTLAIMVRERYGTADNVTYHGPWVGTAYDM